MTASKNRALYPVTFMRLYAEKAYAFNATDGAEPWGFQFGNRLQIDDWDGWSDRAIECMLINPGYIGLFVWNRTTKEYNWDTQRFETVNNPWTKWKWYYNPELALVPIEVYECEIATLHEQLRGVKSELAIADHKNAPVPPQLDVERVETYLSDLRNVLNQEVPAAAEAIRTLTGPIVITQEPYENKKRGARWIAKFTPDVMRLLGQQAVRLDYPDSRTMEFLRANLYFT